MKTIKIRITKETQDKREGIEKILPVGKEIRMIDSLAKEYLDAGEAELVDQAPEQLEEPAKKKGKKEEDKKIADNGEG